MCVWDGFFVPREKVPTQKILRTGRGRLTGYFFVLGGEQAVSHICITPGIPARLGSRYFALAKNSSMSHVVSSSCAWGFRIGRKSRCAIFYFLDHLIPNFPLVSVRTTSGRYFMSMTICAARTGFSFSSTNEMKAFVSDKTKGFVSESKNS